MQSRRPSGLRKTTNPDNSLAHRTTWLRSDFDLAIFVLGTNLEKGKECKQLKSSVWEITPLNFQQIRYAVFDALVSFEIAKGPTSLGYMLLDE